jgi:predicted DNA-binding ribbon-helix-helix protein
MMNEKSPTPEQGTTQGSSQTPTHAPGTLLSKNVRIHNRRTSVRLEPAMWNALNEIAALEGCSIHDLCGAVHDLKEKEASFTAALRVFMMEYYRSAMRVNSQVSQVQKKVQSFKTQAT